jgi:hypothetical protein
MPAAVEVGFVHLDLTPTAGQLDVHSSQPFNPISIQFRAFLTFGTEVGLEDVLRTYLPKVSLVASFKDPETVRGTSNL